MTTFALHQNLASKHLLHDLPLCSVFLENEKHYPWLILVPRRSRLSKLMDVAEEDQAELYREIDFAQKVLWKLFHPTQLNVAAIGNKTPQLHIHVIARQETDPAWPGTVWDHGVRVKYSPEELKAISQLITEELQGYNLG